MRAARARAVRGGRNQIVMVVAVVCLIGALCGGIERGLVANAGIAEMGMIEDVGEEGFRQREEAMIAELVHEDGIVLATGGGVVMRPANRAALKSGGLVVYLCTSVEQQLQRLQHLVYGVQVRQVMRAISLDWWSTFPSACP